MKLNLWVLYDWLKEFHPQVRCTKPKHVITGIRLYQPDQPVLDYALYLGHSDDFAHDGQPDVMCWTQGDYLLLETQDVTAVLNRVQDAFSFYSRWYDACLDDIAQGCTLSALVARADEIFSMPLIIVNAAQIVIAHSSNLERGVDPEDLESVENRHSLPEDKLFEFNQRFKTSFYTTEIYQVPRGIFPTNSYCKHIFSRDGERLGTAILKVAPEDFSSSQQFLLSQFMNLVERWVDASHENVGSFHLTSYFVSALEGRPDLPVLERQLALFSWETGCRKQVLIVSAPTGPVRLNMHLIRELTREDLSVCIVPYQGRIVILCNLDLAESSGFFQRLSALLSERGYCGASSFAFTDLEQFSKSYQQALTILEYSAKLPGVLCRCQDIAMSIAAKLLRDYTATSLVHPALAFFKEYDATHGTELYPTLFSYLRNERRSQQTAQELFIHRNTLSLRLEKLQALYPLDLDDADERFYLLFSFSLDQIGDSQPPDPS
ncbi:MAG: helix-turn-helix domain-containing protein [Oscillospiraceae bacterium]|nr:helix-turn-helix domain-containing protein [Oscillospiraceae bacterium]